MQSQLFLCALVGLAAASDSGWKSNTEYVYKVHGRTLTGLPDVADQYSGMVMKAKMIVRPKPEGALMAKIVDSQYAQIHTQLPGGWKSEIPESQLSYKNLPLSEMPFEIVMKNGVVRDLIVDKKVYNWEANILKSIVSQIQLDIQGKNVIKSQINQLPEESSNNAVFKTMEDTVTGKYETLYDITPLPEYVLQSKPWLAPLYNMKGDGDLIEIVKSKNFSRSEERVGYHHGLHGMGRFEPNTNQMEEFFLRSSLSRVIITGSLKQYAIQSSVTTNKIILSPTLNNEQNGMVVSELNLTLASVESTSEQFQPIAEPQRLGSLVYRYNEPFASTNGARPGQQQQSNQYASSTSSEEDSSRRQQQNYKQRSTSELDNRKQSDSESSDSLDSEENWQQEQPKLQDAPSSPMLPYFIGNKGQSIKRSDKIQIEQAVQNLAEQIGSELERPEILQDKQTLAKFNILSSLVEILDEKEMQQVASKLYNKEIEGAKSFAWKAFRDAVAECGTGPALLTIQAWILTGKIQNEEAAEVIAAMSRSTRQPTEEYMRTFFRLATKQEVQSQYLLNDTAILAYTNLARQVYVDKYASHNQFPVDSFGSFRTKEGEQFLVEEVIQHLTKMLKQSVQKAETHKIHVYIRALGNIAHQRILAAFEPYLEGDKQVSQFQRLSMVLALDKLVKVHPKVARSVLYKIYQNAGEEQEVRCAAIFQLIRTSPPASMLQRMAQYTNVDTDQQVNAAAKSAIQSAAQLDGAEFAELRENARAAEPLLTTQEFGIHYSRDNLRSYVVEEMNMLYKQTLQYIGSEDSFFPKTLKYALRAGLGGARRQLVDIQAMVSSIDELTNVLDRQTESHKQEQKQQKQYSQQAEQHQYSSESIARLLNIETDEREQLEGSLQLQLSGAQRFFSFDNRTIEMLPEIIREVEETLRSGKNIHYTKFTNRYEITLSFPIEMGFPFFYTLDAPTLLSVNGQIRATAEPQVSIGDKLNKPNIVSAKSAIRTILSTRVEAQLGFVTPFDHQQYVSGYDKNTQVYLPLKTEWTIDIKNKQIEGQVQAIEPEKNSKVFHYSTWPYTAQQDILELLPISQTKNHQIVYSQPKASAFQAVVGRKSGMAFRVEYTSEQKYMDAQWLFNQARRHDAISALLAPIFDESIQHTELNIEYVADQSSARKVQFRLGYEEEYVSDAKSESRPEIRDFAKLPRDSLERQKEFLKMAASGINSARSYAYDLAVELDGQNKVQYSATAALAYSPVDKNSRFIFFAKKHSKNKQESKPYEFALSANNQIPNANGLDFAYALQFDPTSTTEIELAFGESLEQADDINIKAKLQKSETRKLYLQSLPEAQQCEREMQQGNLQLPACANMTAIANLMDRVQIRIEYNNITPAIRNATDKVYNALSYLWYFNLDEDNQVSNPQSVIEIEARFEPDFKAVNVSLETAEMLSHFNLIRVNSWIRPLVTVHPNFPVAARFMGKALALQVYRPFCTIDQNEANTFDNKTYPVDQLNGWTVIFQYVPTLARHQNHESKYVQEQQELTEQYAILVRDAKSNKDQQEIKITFRNVDSEGKLYEIDLKPTGQSQQNSGSSPAAKVSVNQREYQYNDKDSTDIEDGLIMIYALPNGEVKVEIRDAFYVIFDGYRTKLTTTNDEFRYSSRGLCGNFDGELANEFLTPENCIVRDPRDFVESYSVENGQQQQQQQQKQQQQQQQQQQQNSECYYEEPIYANVISKNDIGSGRHQYENEVPSSSCIKHQTRYVVDEENSSQICFTTRPVAVCKSSCSARDYISKRVPVHCVQKSNITDLWKKQIEKGASPDFSLKSVTRSVEMRVPQTCA